MAIRVTLTGEGFVAVVTPPHGDLRSFRALSATELLATLSEMGCHSTDVTDALDASGVEWRPTHDGELLRQREIEDWRGVDVGQIREQLRMPVKERVRVMVDAANRLLAVQEHARAVREAKAG